MRVSGGAHSYGPTERQIDAQTRVNAIARITKPERIMVLTMVVIGGESITEMARLGGVGKERVSADLRAALDRIAEFYDGQPHDGR